MAGLPLPPVPYTKSWAQIVADFAAAAQGASAKPLDFSEGSVFLALAQAEGDNADWLQKLYLFALLVARLRTSAGPWADSWTADFMPAVGPSWSATQPYNIANLAGGSDGNLYYSRINNNVGIDPVTDNGNNWLKVGTNNSPRLPANAATGLVTFTSYAPQSQRIIPVGALVSTADGSQVFQVYADTSNAAYSATIIPGGGFILPANQASLTVGVQALTPGAGGNVGANTITALQSSLVGVDTVTNTAPITTGLDEESDDALKARFQLWLQSLRAGTPGAIKYTIVALQQGLQVALHENVDPDGSTDYGAITVYVDDGSGAIPTATVLLALAAVNGVQGRAASVRPSVIAASKLLANISMTVAVKAGWDIPTVLAAVANAVGAYVNALGLEATLPYTQLANVAYQASAGVANITSLLLNNGTADLVPAMGQTIKVGTLAAN